MTRTPRRILLAALASVLGAAALAAGPAAVAAEPHGTMLEARPNIRIESDAEFTRENGVRSGRGTAARPYVISGWHVGQIFVSDTSKHLVIRDNAIDGALILDWNGSHVHVHGNRIGQLHANRNVKRTGTATSGAIAHNTIGVVSQLRHFDGVFEHNVVGNPAPDTLGRHTAQAVQFDGFNGARFRFNTIYGYVEARLHGHHHGSGFGMPSHEHATHEGHAGHMAVNHARRYHEVWITGNTIVADHTYALRYYDTGHAGNDRTNNSETNKALRKPHIHFTRIHLTNNRLVGSGLAVHVFNAPDEQKHTGTTRGLMEIRGNRITLRDDALQLASGARDGIALRTLHDVNLRIAGNVIEGPSATPGRPLDALGALYTPAGIRIEGVKEGRIWITDNVVSRREYGVFALRFDQDVVWSVRGLRTDHVAEPVHYDATVRNDPSP